MTGKAPEDFQPIWIAPRKKRCERCGKLIPNNGYQTNERGEVEVDDKGHAITHRNPRLVCECWAEVVPPKPRVAKRKKGERDLDQPLLDLRNGEKVK